MSTAGATKPGARRPRKRAREPNLEVVDRALPVRQIKTNLVLDLLTGSEGATLNQLGAATGRLPHTARTALTDLRKNGHAITSEKLAGQGRVYWVMAG